MNINVGIQRAKPTYCITTDKYFNSATAAANYYNLSISSVSACCTGKNKSCTGVVGTRGGLKFCYVDKADECKTCKNLDSFDDIAKNIVNKMYENTLLSSNDKKPESFVFDEDLSVRENKRLVAEWNARVDYENNEYENENNRLLKMFDKHLRDAVVLATGVRYSTAKIIVDQAHDNILNSTYYYVVQRAKELCKFINKIRSVNNDIFRNL